MNVYQACEQAYHNGFEAGLASANNQKAELKTRLKIAYEQAAIVCAELSKSDPFNEYATTLRCIQEAISKLADAQDSFGVNAF
jgi:hypothetical protein